MRHIIAKYFKPSAARILLGAVLTIPDPGNFQARLRSLYGKVHLILTDGKPEIDDDTGLVSYHDQQGNRLSCKARSNCICTS